MVSSRILVLASLLTVVLAAPRGDAFRLRRQEADAQASPNLEKAVIQPGLAQDGQESKTPDAGQVPSLTSLNNFINYCLTQDAPLTNGLQIKAGSCNPTPMGRIAAKTAMPNCKFVFPTNFDTSLVENTPFTIKLKIQNLETGNFVNAAQNYYAAPQQVNAQGLIIGHSHVVVQKMESLDQVKPLDPNVFAFFKGLNDKADGTGVLSANVTAGLPAGAYRLASINTGANHQPALVAVAQHGSTDDAIYFTVKPKGN